MKSVFFKSRFINEIDNDLLELDNKEELKAIKKENKMYDYLVEHYNED